jgi:hypothetical protein
LVSGLSDLLLSLFLNEDVLKVGIGFAQDLRKLRGDFGQLTPFQVTLQNYVDLTPLLKLIPDPDAEEREKQRRQQATAARSKATARKAAMKAQKQGGGSATPSPPLPEGSPSAAEARAGGGYTHQAKKEGGLLKLVRVVLRRHLDKSEQISNWSKRPLAIPQQQYAALDAYACILIWEEVQRRGVELEAENIESTNV